MKVRINRAPVMTLWAAVVAERLGYDRETALTLGRAVAGLNAQSKGRRLGIFEASPGEEGRPEPAGAGARADVRLLGRLVPAQQTPQGLRAMANDQPIDPRRVNRYLEQKFGPDLAQVREAMEALAGAYERDQLAARAYALYEQFRPKIPEGQRGWGAAGELDLDQLQALARRDA